MNRPVGVVILAVLEFIGAAFCLLAGLLAIAGAGFIGAMGRGSAAGMGGLVALMGGAISVVFFVVAAIAILVGWGLLTLKNWARIVAIVLSAIGALFQLFVLITRLSSFAVASFIPILIGLAINGAIIWYLSQANVSAAFRGGQARAASA